MSNKRVYLSGCGWGAKIFRGVKSVTLVFCVVLLPLCYILEFGNPFLSYPGPPPLQKVFSDHIKLMKGRYGLAIRGTGVGQENRKLRQVMISYHSDRVVSVDEAREMWLVAAQSLLELLNESSGLQKELTHTPMTIINTGLNIGFATTREDLAQYPEDRRVVDVLQFEDEILFTAYVEGRRFPTTFHTEKYEEALKIVRESKVGSKSLVE